MRREDEVCAAPIDAFSLRAYAREATLYEFAKAIVGPIAAFPGNFSIAAVCTWHTIWDEGGVGTWREYRIHCQAGMVDVEVDGVIVRTNLAAGQGTDVGGRTIRVHAKAANSSGQYERV